MTYNIFQPLREISAAFLCVNFKKFEKLLDNPEGGIYNQKAVVSASRKD